MDFPNVASMNLYHSFLFLLCLWYALQCSKSYILELMTILYEYIYRDRLNTSTTNSVAQAISDKDVLLR